MTSSIKLFIYEVLGPKIVKNSNLNILYSFNKLKLRDNNNNSPIVPIEIKNKKSSKEYLFSKNIIKNTDKKNEIIVEDYNNIPFLYKIYKKFIVRQNINHIFPNNEIKVEIKEQVYNKIKDLIKYNQNIFKEYFKYNYKSKTEKNSI